MRLGVKHDVVCGHKLQNECETDLFAQADSIRGRAGRMSSDEQWGLLRSRLWMEWVNEVCAGKIQIVGTLAGSGGRWVPLSKIFVAVQSHDPTS